MADAPAAIPTQNPIAAFINGVVQAATVGGETAVEAFIAAEVPFLEAPVVSVFTNYFVDQVAQAVSTQIQNIVTSIVIDVQTGLETSAVYMAAQALQKAQDANDPAAIAAAIQGAVNAYAGLVNSDGVFTPSP